MNFSYLDMQRPLAPGMSTSAQPTGNDENPAPEKTVPFLRSLTEMLLNNHDLISFVPGERCNGKVKTPGRIIVHDRNRIQSQVLPFYFNHASFASLRRQLSYFSFVRLGKERQSGTVTYINDAVVELSDILHLKRRTLRDGSQARDVKEDKQGQDQRGAGGYTKTGGTNLQRDRTQEQSRDVASAVLSGRLHACETNHDLDAKKCHPTLSGTTSKSVSGVTLGTKSRAAKASDKISSNKKRRSSKYKKGRKGGARIDRLLYINTIVPFIHLPVRLFKATGIQECTGKDTSQGPSSASVRSTKERHSGKASRNRACSNSSDDEETAYPVRKRKKSRTRSSNSIVNGNKLRGTPTSSSLTESNFDSARSENARNLSESAASALLALGSRR